MTINEARQLFEYDSWANARMFQAAEALKPDQLTTAVASSFPSIGATLAHIVGAEWIWLRRWLGESPPGMPDWVTNPVVAELKLKHAEIGTERSSFFARLTDGDVEKVFTYHVTGGKSFSQPLGQLMRHLINHSTYHRGQLATQLRQLGCTPPNTDFIRYLREQQ
jgi:uncharacterized damage-inducible protein DinB